MSLYSGTYTTIYIRKVLGNNSLIEFHKYYSSRTMKIPLNDAHEYNGGDLIYLTDGKIHKPEQLKGSVTIHNNDIIHGVTPIVNGTRYSLFILDTP
jgi:predicted 2-oxoglutarate/Fe(II)-dependent dioxygenase YbiX